MSDYRLAKNEFVEPTPDDLFQHRKFFELHAGGTGFYFEWLKEGRSAARVHFTQIEPAVWRSPARGTYGGYHYAAELGLADLGAFCSEVEAALAKSGASKLEIVLAPAAHDQAAFANVTYLLLSSGWRIDRVDLNHSIEIDDRSLSERMSYGNRKRVRKAMREGLRADQLSLDSLPEVYRTLEINRAAKGYELSMTLPQLGQMAEMFPDRMLLFGLPDQGELAAAAVCLRVTTDVLYVFYWGDLPGYSKLSPVALLASRIYDFCGEAGIRILDVGTSTVGREPNDGLIHFKRGLGFSESLKLWLAKDL